MSQIRRSRLPLKRGTLLAASTPYYYKFKLSAELVSSIQIQWHDTASAFAATLYTTNVEDPAIPAVAAAGPDLEIWHSEAADVPISTVSAGAAGCDMVHLGNNGAKWVLLKIEPSANCIMSVLLHGKE